MWRQIISGSAVMAISIGCHIAILVTMVDALPILAGAWQYEGAFPLITAFVAVLVGHTVEVWIWAFALRGSRAIGTLEDAVYFALVTTTTLGYGDLTLARKWRIFGAMAAVSGLMTFGLSTAFLIEVFARIYGP